MKNNYTVGLYTLGCKVSQYETEAIGEEFEKRGFSVRPFSESCDAYVINTCTVTAESDRKSRQIIRRALKYNPCAVVAAVGCYSQRAPQELLRIGGVSIVLGTQDKLSVVDRVICALDDKKSEAKSFVTPLDDACFEPMCITRAPRTRAYLKIEDGCEARCSYCAISGARGRVRSKPREDVIAEVEGLYRAGTREIVLTGIETGSYGRDFDERYGLADLICELNARHSCDRIRLGSLAPELIGADFVKKVSGCAILAPHFHLSVQSGSDKILRAMKRRYSSAMAYENIARLKEAFPTAQFTTDMMVGFPGEGEDDFSASLDFIRRVGFLDVHVFAYSKREGTPAAYYDGQLDESIKRARSAQMIRVKDEVRDRILEDVVRSTDALSVIPETCRHGVYTAHSDSFIEVSFKSDACIQGDIVKVRPVSHKNGVLLAELLG